MLIPKPQKKALLYTADWNIFNHLLFASDRGDLLNDFGDKTNKQKNWTKVFIEQDILIQKNVLVSGALTVFSHSFSAHACEILHFYNEGIVYGSEVSVEITK